MENDFSLSNWSAFEVWLQLADTDETIHLALLSWTDKLLSRQATERIAAGVTVYGPVSSGARAF